MCIVAIVLYRKIREQQTAIVYGLWLGYASKVNGIISEDCNGIRCYVAQAFVGLGHAPFFAECGIFRILTGSSARYWDDMHGQLF